MSKQNPILKYKKNGKLSLIVLFFHKHVFFLLNMNLYRKNIYQESLKLK